MDRKCMLSNVTKEYLEAFNCILDEMIQGMTNAKLTDSISYNFIVQMIPHHMAAVEMSRNILRYTTNIPLQNIALQIIKEQTESIENMQEIKCSCGDLCNTEQDLCGYLNKIDQIMQTMFCSMQNACSTNNINADFMREMIPHHMGAVEMSETALMYDICPELRPVLSAIIISQKRGIMQMQHLLRCMHQ